MIFLRRYISFNIRSSFPLKIFCDKTLIFHMEVIRYELLRSFIIFYHKIGIFANDMDLLDLLLIEFIQLPIIFSFIFDFIVKDQTSDLHTVV